MNRVSMDRVSELHQQIIELTEQKTNCRTSSELPNDRVTQMVYYQERIGKLHDQLLDIANVPLLLFTYYDKQEGQRLPQEYEIVVSLAAPLRDRLSTIQDAYSDIEWSIPLDRQIHKLNNQFNILKSKTPITFLQAYSPGNVVQYGGALFPDAQTAMYHGKVVLKDCKISLKGDEVIIEPAPTDDIVIPAAVVKNVRDVIERIQRCFRSP